MDNTTITVAGIGYIGVGSKVEVDTSYKDGRLWTCLKCYILRRPIPLIPRVEIYKVTSVNSDTTITIN